MWLSVNNIRGRRLSNLESFALEIQDLPNIDTSFIEKFINKDIKPITFNEQEIYLSSAFEKYNN